MTRPKKSELDAFEVEVLREAEEEREDRRLKGIMAKRARMAAATPTELGMEIRRARFAVGINTQTELGSLTGISRSRIHQYETGKIKAPGVFELNKIAKVTHTTFDRFFNKTETAQYLDGAKMSKPRAEGELVDIKKLKSVDSDALKAKIGKQKAEIWKLTADTVSSRYPEGAFLVVATDREPEPNQFVLAEIDGVPAFRLFWPPLLQMFRVGPCSSTRERDAKILGVIVDLHLP